MALKPGRETIATDISYFINSITGPDTTRMERGGIVCALTSTPGSGEAMDASAQAVEYATNPSGRKAIGLLVNDFVNIDLSRQQLNQYKDEAQIGMKCTLLRKGWVVTNKLEPTAATGSIPATAYCGSSGNLTQTATTGYPIVGQFMSLRDSDGYAKVFIDLPGASV
jgi:hypothetical protein